MSETLLILGLGSIGSRHARNARALGFRVLGHDPRGVPDGVESVESLEAGLDRKPLGVLVCTPPARHYRDALAVSEAGLPCFVEKPLCLSVEDAAAIVARYERIGLSLAVGYQLQAIPRLQKLRAQVMSGDLGKLYAAAATFGFRLASWRPARATYTLGIVWEASHDTALLEWMLGRPIRTAATNGKTRKRLLGLIEFGGDVSAAIHLDALAPVYQRNLILWGSKRRVAWDYDKAEGDMAYISELEAFARACRGEGVSVCGGRAGLEAVRLTCAIERAAKGGRWETVR